MIEESAGFERYPKRVSSSIPGRMFVDRSWVAVAMKLSGNELLVAKSFLENPSSRKTKDASLLHLFCHRRHPLPSSNVGICSQRHPSRVEILE